MEEQLFKIATSQGIWATLSVILIIYILKAQEKRDLKQEEREKNYQVLISNLIDDLKYLKNVEEQLISLKTILLRKKE